MAVFCQHVHLVVELVQQVLSYVGIEDLFDGDLQLEEFSFVDGAEAAHRDLFPYLQVGLFEDEYSIGCVSFGLDLYLLFWFAAAATAEAGLGSCLRSEHIGLPRW